MLPVLRLTPFCANCYNSSLKCLISRSHALALPAATYHSIIHGDRRGVGAAVVRAGLWWARGPYGVGVWVRNRLFDRGYSHAIRVPVPVVSIGNLTLGGTGKTPCVEYVARFYRDLGYQTAILSRGYGSTGAMNDEAMVLEENLLEVPHLQGRDRVELAMTAVQELESEVLVLDDGFQHRRLARDLDIVLLDATRSVQDEYLFPRGLLREPISELRRASVIMLTRCDQVEADSVARQQAFIESRFPGKPIVQAVHAPIELLGTDGVTASLEDVADRPVAAFCGIGNPEAFRRTVTDLGGKIIAFRTFPDHHPYTRDDVDELQRWAAQLPPDGLVLTTQKDFVKLRTLELGERPLWAVRVGLKLLTGEAAFQERLRSVIPVSS